MVRYAFLVGAAKKDYSQKELEQMHEKLLADGWAENEITIFPNGVNELLLEYALNNCIEQSGTKIFLYICALSQDCIKDDCIALGNDEIRKSVIAYYADLAEKMGVGFRVEYDWDGEFVKEEDIEYERVEG